MRVLIERALRSLAAAVLLYAWWISGRDNAADAVRGEPAVIDGSTPNAAQLARLIADPRRQQLHLSFRDVPNAATRQTLHAAQQAGVGVSWEAADSALALSPIALSATPLGDPAGGTLLHVAARDGNALVLADSVGWIDSAVVMRSGLTWTLPANTRDLAVSYGGTIARVRAPDSVAIGRVRLFATPGWEARFVLRALEEAGWSVDADFVISPRATVTAGAPATLDTTRYAAVIALDSSAWTQSAAIDRFVRSGGGLVLLPDAARGTSMRSLRVGAPAAERAGVPGALQTASPREGLALAPIQSLSPTAVVIERSERADAPVAIAARRLGAGRVLQVGYRNTWEWRMLGADDALEAHRHWWQALLHRTAFVSRTSGEQRDAYAGDAAPLADLVARVGPWRSAPASPTATDASPTAPPAWLYVVAAGSLLVAWWSRRLRGAR